MSTLNWQTLTCDRCGLTETIPGKSTGKLQLLRVRIVGFDGLTSYENEFARAEWCYACRVALHMQRPTAEVIPAAGDPPPPEPQPTKPSLEDYIREIVREEMES